MILRFIQEETLTMLVDMIWVCFRSRPLMMVFKYSLVLFSDADQPQSWNNEQDTGTSTQAPVGQVNSAPTTVCS